jgi:hypothetical protein
MMNQNETTQILKLTFAVTAMIVLTSCGNTKEDTTSNNTNTYASTAAKPLASCNKKSTTDIGYSSTAVQNQVGAQDNNWLKVKMTFLSTTATASGNVLKFFKWKMVNGVPYLDKTPMSFYTYNISSGVASTTAVNQIAASSVNSLTGYNVYLNDASGTYQVIKAVVYSSSGSVIAQSDSLIPQFMSNPVQYAYNSDGSARATGLQALHPLNGVSTTGWSDAAYASYFQAFCF